VVVSPVAVKFKQMVWSFNTLPEGEEVLCCICLDIIMIVNSGDIICLMVCLGPNLSECWSKSLDTDNIQKLPQQLLHLGVLGLLPHKGIHNRIII
jgi:hypothetical protein